MNIYIQIRKYSVGASEVTDNSLLDIHMEIFFPGSFAFLLFGICHWRSLELCMEELRSVKYLLLIQKNMIFLYWIKIYLIEGKLIPWSLYIFIQVFVRNSTSTHLGSPKIGLFYSTPCLWWQQPEQPIQLCNNKSCFF